MICRSRSCVICLRSGQAAPTLDLDLGWCVGERARRIGIAAARLRDGNAISKLFMLSFFFGTSRNQRARGPSRNPVGLNENVLPPLYYENSPLAGINSFCVRRLLERKTCDGVSLGLENISYMFAFRCKPGTNSSFLLGL